MIADDTLTSLHLFGSMIKDFISIEDLLVYYLNDTRDLKQHDAVQKKRRPNH